MVSRYTGACLGLLAFAIAVVAGLLARNPPMLVLSRAVWALVVFCVIGLLLGTTAQAVLSDHRRRREEAVLAACRAGKTNGDGGNQTPDTAHQEEPEPTPG